MGLHPECDRAREWSSLQLDGELSDFEHVLLGSHLSTCEECRHFSASVTAFTVELRAVPLERPERPVVVRKHRRALSLARAPVAAALAVMAVGLGTLLTSSELGNSPDRAVFERPAAAELDATNLMRQAEAKRRQVDLKRRRFTPFSTRANEVVGGAVVDK